MRNCCVKNADVVLEIEPDFQIFLVENEFFEKVGNLDFHPLKMHQERAVVYCY